MIKPRLLFGVCMVAGTLLFASCSNDENNPLPDGTSGEVPALVLDEFNSLFPGATNVVWSTKGEYVVASFYWDGSRADNVVRNHTAWFALANGVWGMTEKEIRFADLPEAVKNAFGASEYGQAPWRADDEVDVLKRNGNSEILYVIDVEKNEGGKETDVDLYYTAEGVLVKEVIDAEDEKDYQDYLPQTPSGTVESWLKEKYPDARIIDVDNEDGGTEVEFISGNMKHEAFFDRSQNWVYTKTEYRFRNIDEVTDIPSQVLAALKATPEYLEAGWVEDAEKYETEKAGTFYCFELENRFDDDVKVYIGSDGTVLQGRPDFGGESSGGAGVATDIEKFIQENYPGAVIIERGYDDGYIEVDIRHDGKEKELLFNGKNEWIRTSWEIRYNELPSAVTSALEAEGYQRDDDEVEVVQTPDASWYEVEVRRQGREYKVFIDESGKIIKVVED